ncbi:MAG: hypothetical protein RIE53_00275 [Rhodothermales bacterium]
MELDKSLMTLSAGGIAIVVTLLSTIGSTSRLQQWLYISILGAFGSAILLILTVYKLNALLAKGAATRETRAEVDPRYSKVISRTELRLTKIDKCVLWFFRLGITASLVLGLTLTKPRSQADYGEGSETKNIERERGWHHKGAEGYGHKERKEEYRRDNQDQEEVIPVPDDSLKPADSG